jgi:two-component sensor histidine kinase
MNRQATLVIVDDNEEQLHALMEILGKEGYRALPANSGELALEAMNIILPDLIIMNIRLPGIDGYEVCRRIKSEPVTRDIPVIFISIFDRIEERIAGFRAGGVDFIQRPFNTEEVALRVKTQIELRGLRLELEARVTERTAELEREILARRTAEESLLAALKDKDILMMELEHRTKNNLNLVASIIALGAEAGPEVSGRDVLRSTESRVRSMALVYQRLYRSNDLSSVDLAVYIPELVNSLAETYISEERKVTLEYDLVHLNIGSRKAITLGLIVNELITNSLKYAYAGHEGFCLRIGLSREGEGAELVLSDNGPGFPPGFDPAKGQGLGLTLVRGLCEQLEGEMGFRSGRGATIWLRFSP